MAHTDPQNIESFEAMLAKREKEADQAKIDARIDEDGLDYEGAAEAMGGMGKIDPKDGKEIAFNARDAEANDPDNEDPEALLAQLDGDEPLVGAQGENGEESVLREENTPEDRFNAPDAGAENNEYMSQNLSIDENPMSPLVDRLVKGGYLGEIVGTEIKTRMTQGESFDKIITKNDLSSEIPEGYEKYLIGRHNDIIHSDPDIVGDNINSFKNDFESELKSLADSTNIGEERFLDIQAQIGSAYITGGDPDEKEAAFEMAIATAINTEFDTVKTSFHRTVEFEVLFEDIKNPKLNRKQRIEAYSDVLDMLYTDTGAKGGRRKRDSEAAMRRLQLQNSGMQERFEAVMQELAEAREQENHEQVKKLEEEIEEIKKETRGVLETPIGNFNIAVDGEKQQSETNETA